MKLQGHADQLKESVIGVEVFGRKADYDPRSDPVVRMEACKLRARLAEYYAGDGAGDAIRIEIPKGAYVPQWQSRAGIPAGHSWKRIAALTLPLFLVVGGLAVWRWGKPGTNPAKPTIAVLPFANLSPEP